MGAQITGGIVNCVGNGNFDPNEPITNEEMAVMLNNYIRYTGSDLKYTYEKSALGEKQNISPWAKESIENLQMAGIFSNKSFDAQSVSTRAEAATIFVKFIEASIQ